MLSSAVRLMPVRRNSQRCDITLDDLEGDDVGFTPPPPYSGRRNEEPTMNSKKVRSVVNLVFLVKVKEFSYDSLN